MWKKISAKIFMVLGLFCTSANAQSCSADFVSFDATGKAAGEHVKIRASSGKVRIETSEFPGDFFVVDPEAATAFLVRPHRRIFMDAKQTSRWTQLFVPVDPWDPCVQWRAMAKVAEVGDDKGQWSCTRLGEEDVKGRQTIKYRIVSPQGETKDAWIDPHLKFLVKIRNDDGSGVEMTEAVEDEQMAGVFDIPSNYGKFDPLRLIERIKQSDVWVEPPK